MFRTVDHSPGLRQGLRGCVSVGTLSWDQTSPLSGRLVGSLLLGAGSQAGRPVAALALSHPRDCDEREEVGSRALADCEESRHDHRYRGRQGFSVSGASREIPDGSGELLYHGRSPSSALAGDPRSPGFARAAGSSRSPSDALLAVASEGALVPRVRPSLSSSALATGSETGPVLVDGEGSSVDGGSIRDTCSGSSPLFGMGHSPSRSTRVRGVVRPGEVAAHQSSRNEGSFLRPSGIPRRCHRSSRDSDVRQFDGRGVCQQAYELSGSEQPVPAPQARETRGIAPSLLFKKNFAVDQVLKAGTWSRHTTFTRHYLRDLAHRSLDTFHLGPVVAAQAVV